MKVEGSVTLSISELDNLRAEIKNLTEEKEDLLKHQGKVLVNLTVTEKYSSYDTVSAGSTWDSVLRCSRDLYKVVEKQGYRLINESHQYVSLDDVKKDIEEEARAAVIEEIGKLQRTVSSLRRDIEDLKTVHANQVSTLTNVYQKEKEKLELEYEEHINTLKKNHANTVTELQKTIDELNGFEVDRTKDEVIIKLQREIETLRLKKGFWGFLH